MSSKDMIISFSIGGKLSLEKAGKECFFPDDLVSLPDFNQIGLENQVRVKKICSFLDEHLWAYVPFFRKNGICVFSACYYKIKLFFDILYSTYFILNKLFEMTDFDRVVVIKDGDYVIDKGDEGKMSLLPSLAEHVFKKKLGVKLKIIARPHRLGLREFSKGGQSRQLLKDILKYLPEKARRFEQNGLLLKDSHDIPYLIRGPLTDVNFFKVDITSKFFCIYSIYLNKFSLKTMLSRKGDFDTLIGKAFDDFSKEKQYRDLFLSDDDGLFDFANNCLRDYLSISLSAFLSRAERFKEDILRLKPRLLLTSGCRLDMRSGLVLELAKALNIPIITYQEGGGAGYLNWPLFSLDVENSDYFLVYGEGVRRSPFFNGAEKLLPVGSMRLDRIRKKIGRKDNNHIKIYIVLDIIKSDTYQHYPYNGSFFSQAYRHQENILRLLKDFRQVTFVLKTLKGREFLYRKYADGDLVTIETRPLSSILEDASGFVLDFPSTALQECLLTDKPIALLHDADAVRFGPDALNMLKKRIRVSSEPHSFVKVLQELIKDCEEGSAMAGDCEFLNNFCVMKDSEKSLRTSFAHIQNG